MDKYENENEIMLKTVAKLELKRWRWDEFVIYATFTRSICFLSFINILAGVLTECFHLVCCMLKAKLASQDYSQPSSAKAPSVLAVTQSCGTRAPPREWTTCKRYARHDRCERHKLHGWCQEHERHDSYWSLRKYGITSDDMKYYDWSRKHQKYKKDLYF